ncbi:hypothetical protein [Thaumasiovibrio subtropicus]|uniref:hypothetical protein n=1 Tax=Thaumasiovibrio subtropicus TaxID=1891207 RepID=UPI000B35A1B5|nr:hypothetical protein [Thaumasiovibrio subtropicus]
MKFVSPFPDQQDNLFNDSFNKWPVIFHCLVFSALLITLLPFLLELPILSRPNIALDAISIWTALHILLFFWGVILKIRAKTMWYRSYHIGKSLLLLLLLTITDLFIIAALTL